MDSFAERLIRAHQAGVADRQVEQQMQQRAEDRKLQQDILKHQIARLKIQDQLEQRAAATQQAKLMEGQPGQVVPDVGPENELPAVGDQPAVPLGGNKVLPHPAIPLQAIPEMGLPATSLQPQTLQELWHRRQMEATAASQQKIAEAQAEPFTLPVNAKRFIPSLEGGEPQVFTNPAPEPPSRPPSEGEIGRALAAAFYRQQHKITNDQPLIPAEQALADAEYEAYKAKLRKGSEDTADQTAVALTPEATELAARRYLTDGSLPPMGMGAKASAARSQIINRAAKLDPTAAIAVNKATYDATKAALTQITKNVAAVNAFEQTALKNLDQFIGTARKVVDSGSPWINRGLRSVDRSLLGKPEQAAYDAARQVAFTEIARVVSNPNLAGVLSDNARREMETVLSGDATLKQTLAAAQLLRQDMANRKTSLTDEQKVLTDQLKTIGAVNVTAPKQTGVGPNGNLWEKDATGWHDTGRKP